MSDMDRRAFVGAAAVSGVAAAVLAASSAMAAGQTGYFVIAEIVSKKDKADDLRALLVPFAEQSAKEPGCLVYTLMEVIGDLSSADGVAQQAPEGAHVLSNGGGAA